MVKPDFSHFEGRFSSFHLFMYYRLELLKTVLGLLAYWLGEGPIQKCAIFAVTETNTLFREIAGK